MKNLKKDVEDILLIVTKDVVDAELDYLGGEPSAERRGDANTKQIRAISIASSRIRALYQDQAWGCDCPMCEHHTTARELYQKRKTKEEFKDTDL